MVVFLLVLVEILVLIVFVFNDANDITGTASSSSSSSSLLSSYIWKAAIVQEKDHVDADADRLAAFPARKDGGSRTSKNDTDESTTTEQEQQSFLLPNNNKYNFVQPPEGYQFLLQQPFYVYESLVWLENATLDGQTIRQHLEHGVFTDKHGEDLWCLASALSHPLRTMDPERAQLFVVPSLISQISSRDHEYCLHISTTNNNNKNNTICDTHQLLDMIEIVLEQSPWFQRSHGADHVLVATHFLAPKVLPLHRTLMQCHMIVMENRNFHHRHDSDRYMIPSYYMGNPCPSQPNDNSNGDGDHETIKTADFVQVASMKPKYPTFKSRRDICQWLQQSNHTVQVCGTGQQCPALRQARFGFHARGDTFGANRLMDTILSGTVPIFTMKEQYQVLPDWIDWEAISVFATVSNRQAFLRDVNGILTDTEQYQTKMAAIRANRDLFEWRNGVPFDTYMYMLWWHLQVQQGHTPPSVVSSPFSILKLPKGNSPAPYFQAFDRRSKNVWCGPHGPAPSCAQCPRLPNIPPTRTCVSMCRWCPSGSVESLLIPNMQSDTCVPFHHTCR